MNINNIVCFFTIYVTLHTTVLLKYLKI